MSDHTHGHAHHHDGRAAFTGLIVGGLLVGAILFGVVKLTNAKYAGEHGGAHATETK
jgi:uncharacterized protein (DUF983 family)